MHKSTALLAVVLLAAACQTAKPLAPGDKTLRALQAYEPCIANQLMQTLTQPSPPATLGGVADQVIAACDPLLQTLKAAVEAEGEDQPFAENYAELTREDARSLILTNLAAANGE